MSPSLECRRGCSGRRNACGESKGRVLERRTGRHGAGGVGVKQVVEHTAISADRGRCSGDDSGRTIFTLLQSARARFTDQGPGPS